MRDVFALISCSKFWCFCTFPFRLVGSCGRAEKRQREVLRRQLEMQVKLWQN